MLEVDLEAQAKWLLRAERQIEALQADVLREKDRLIEHLVLMRREGFDTPPEDAKWEPVVMTPEMEADIEEARQGGK